MNLIKESLIQIRARIAAAEYAAGRAPRTVELLAVSKGQSVAAIRTVLDAGQNALGENYLQEAIPKIEALNNSNINWHYIGKIQKRKTRLIAHYFDWVQTVDSLEVAHALSMYRSRERNPLNICIQINISREPQKAGVLLEELNALVEAIAPLPRLRLRGLMAIPAVDAKAAAYEVLHHAFLKFQSRWHWDILSIGMSQDLEIAIAYGATCVRVGTAIFGKRG